MRYQHYLTSPKRAIWPSAVACVTAKSSQRGLSDTQTDAQYVDCAWGAILLEEDVGRWKTSNKQSGDTSASLWSTIRRWNEKQRNLWILSDHCGEVWHLLGYWEMLDNGHIRLFGTDPRCGRNPNYPRRNGRSGYICIEDPPNIAKFRLGDCNRPITWVDVRNYGVCSDEHRQTLDVTVHWLADWFCAAADIVRDNQLGGWQATVGSQAMHGWKASYKSTGVYAHVNPRVSAIESRAYHGGRCEAYVIGDSRGAWHQLDYRSMYPGICCAHSVPVRLRAYTDNCFGAYGIAERTPESSIAEVTIETDSPDYPYRARLPIQLAGDRNGRRDGAGHTVRDTEIIFPVGRFETVLCGPELAHALEQNHVRDIHCIAEYDVEPALQSYAERLYGVRESCSMQSIDGIEQYVKSLLVALPGKLGQRERLWVDCPGHSTDVRYGTWYGTDASGHTARYRSIAGHVQRDVQLGFAPDSIPAIAGYVTSAGRIKLLDAIRCAGKANIVYCDTDGIICNDAAFRNLESANMVRNGELGYLRWLQSAEGCAIHGVKHYEIGTQIRNAGVPRCERNSADKRANGQQRRRIAEDLYSGKRPACSNNNAAPRNASLYSGGFVRNDGTVRTWEIRNGNVV